MSTETVEEWGVRCHCAGPGHRAWENGPMPETVARAHLAVLRKGSHPVKLVRRTVTTTEWQEEDDE